LCSRERTGVAWPSSARAVGCSLKWGNERNPCSVLNIHGGLSRFIREGSGDDVRSAWPLCPGRHTCYNGADNGLPKRKLELIPVKRLLSGDWGLKLALMNAELVVIGDQPSSGEYVPRSCTHRRNLINARGSYAFYMVKIHACSQKIDSF